MSKFLNERQVGFDPTHIGFPNLGDCMSLVLVDTNGLFGFHLTRGDLNNTPHFVNFIQNNRNYDGKLTHMYSTCYRSRRYGISGGIGDWKAEMTSIAQAIVYQGPVSGFNLAKSGIKDDKNGAPIPLYMEYRLAAGTCSVFYKQMLKMTSGSGGGTAVDDNIREMAPDHAARKTLFEQGRGNEWDVNNPIRTLVPRLGRGDTSSMTLVTTKSNKGQLHAVKKLDTFTV